MANTFNKFFCEIGTKISESVDRTSAMPEDYISERRGVLPMDFGVFSQAEFINIINNLEPKSSTDINGISNKLIKFVKFEIDKPLVHLFNLSMTTGVFPRQLKTCRTIPIFKSGDNSLCDNYRPISLLSSISKILEKAVANRLVQHLTDNGILYEGQFGFQSKISTVHHLLKLTNYVTEQLNNKNYVVGVFLDLKKAFDVVPHDILLKKLSKMGINFVTLKWFENYLSGRSQRVEIDGFLSDLCEIAISIMQGSILGPILFLCFINDFPKCTELLSLLFADDTAGLAAGPELGPLLTFCNNEMQKIANWFRANRMAVNISKTKYMIFKPKNKKVTINQGEGIIFNNNERGGFQDPGKMYELGRIYNDNPVVSDRAYKLLGVWLDENLSFDFHCNTVISKVSQSNYIINKCKNILPKKSLRTLYLSLVHPHLLYCLPIYGCTSRKNIKKTRYCTKKGYS
jgi:hypothetical protein